jgi:DNA gyrase/topoisomerase IV subunit A
LGLRLGRLTALEEQKLREEKKELTSSIKHLEGFMQDDKSVFETLKTETLELKKHYATPRKTEIVSDTSDLRDEDLVDNGRYDIKISMRYHPNTLPKCLCLNTDGTYRNTSYCCANCRQVCCNDNI